MKLIGPDFYNISDLLTEEELFIQKTAHDFVSNEFKPIINEHFEKGTFPLEIATKLGELGFMGSALPEESGGAGVSNVAYGLILHELELAGVVRYTHYAFMVQGPYRLSVVDWLREQAKESLMHAEMVGEHITSLGEHPTLKIGELLETHKHSTEDILNECLEHERSAIKAYYDLLENIDGKSIMLEEYARTMIATEEMHEAELKKMLRDNF